jgi:gliding motility-associated-like protein
MKNLYFNSIVKKLKHIAILLLILSGFSNTADAQVRKAFTQRTSQYTPNKKIYNLKGDFTMLGNTCLTTQNYSPTTNNNGQFMTYVDTDGDSNTFNSSSSTLVLSTENGAIPACSNIVYAGLYWTGKSSPNATFNVTKGVASPQTVNNTLNIVHNQNIASSSPIYSTNFTLSVTRGGTINDFYPIYTFSGNGQTYAFRFYNSSATNRVTLSVNGGTETNIPVSVNGVNNQATLTTPYSITDGTLTITINDLLRDAGTNETATNTQNNSNANVNVSGIASVTTNVTKTFNKRIVSLKGPSASSYTQIIASTNDIFYPSGSDDDIFSAYAEITDYVKSAATGGLGQYTVADMALLEGNISGTGYSGGWGMIVIYENTKMKWRDVTIFDGYAYVASTNTTGYDLPVSGFNSVQSGNVGVKLGLMASEGDVSFSGDYFRIRNLNTTNYTHLSHSGNSITNFFNSSINTGGTRNPNLANNTGIDVVMLDIPNSGNTIIGNNQTSTNFKYGTTSDTYSIFTIAMSVDAFIPESEAVVSLLSLNNNPPVLPYTLQPGQDAEFSIDIKNLGFEAINNFKVTFPMPFNATYVPGSAVGNIFSPQTIPTPNNVTFLPNLGATGSLVWDFGTLVLPTDSNTVLAKLRFRLRATTDCTILNNTTCGNSIIVDGSMSGIGATTGLAFIDKKVIRGHDTSGQCTGNPLPDPFSVKIESTNYVQLNCQNTPLIRSFSYCTANTSIGTSEIASFFPAGSKFYNQFPVTINSIEYTDANPIPLVVGSIVLYYAVPPNTIAQCNFPFTISKCPPIIALNDTLNGGDGTIGNANIGNVLSNNGNGEDTINGTPVTISQVSITVTTPATPIGLNSNPVPFINPINGQVSVPAGTPPGTYTIIYNLCEINNNANCDPATVTINVTCGTTPPTPPTVACYETATFNATTCQYDITGTIPTPPSELACYQTATFNTTTCQYDVNGTMPSAPTELACYETATFNTTTCQYDITGTQPAPPTIACYETATFNTTTCQYDITGTQPAPPTVACYETLGSFNTTTCTWNVTGTMPTPPTVACYETATFNTTTCQYDVTGTMPTPPTVACYETATFNTTTCQYDITGTQPAPPTLACYETLGSFNTTTCTWNETGTMPTPPTVACYETATFNTTTCQYDVTGTMPTPPTVACYETATFNTTTCQYDVTGTIPTPPTVACYETTTFNTTTCQYDVTGTMPTPPSVACYETATFNTTTCQYDITGTQPAPPTLACYETLGSFNTTTCTWNVTGTMPTPPTVACYETATFNTTTCQYDVTGTEPVQPDLILARSCTNQDLIINLDSLLPQGTTGGVWINVDNVGGFINGNSFNSIGIPLGVYRFSYFINNNLPCPLTYNLDMTVDNTCVIPCDPIVIQSESCNEAQFDTIDLNSLLPAGTPTSGTWTNDDNVGGLTGTIFNAWQVPVGIYTFTYTIVDVSCTRRYEIKMSVTDQCGPFACDNVIIYNAFTPNGDGTNEYFEIKNIEQECRPTNKVEIYNRWGILVYETINYDNNTRRFEGISEGRTTLEKSTELPTGTYFYIIQWTTTEGNTINKNGYLYLTR